MESTITQNISEQLADTPADLDADTKFSGYPMGETSQESLMSIKQAFRDYNELNPDHMVYLFHDHPAKVVYNEDNELVIKAEDEWTITHTLTAGGKWAKITKSGLQYGNPNKTVSKLALSAGRSLLGDALPVLKGIHHGILIDSDWRIVSKEGYDTVSKYYLTESFNMDAIPAEPTDADVQKARGILKELLCDFCYTDLHNGEDSINYQNTIAALASVIIRPSWDGALPFFTLCKGTPRIGGSLLQETIGRLGTGKNWPKHEYPKSAAEYEKLWRSIIMNGEQYCIIDNVTNAHDWVTNNSLSYSSGTGETVIRNLGKLQALKNRPHTFIALNGNNMPITADVCGRVIPVFMETSKRWQDLEWKRSKKEMETLAIEMHPAAIWAMAVFHQNWIAKGRPEPPACSGNISEYSDWYYEICGMLAAAGYTHILENLRDVQTIDNDADAQTAGFINALNKNFPWGASFTAADLVKRIMDQARDWPPETLTDSNMLQYINDDAIIEKAKRGVLTPDRIGRFLSDHLNKVVTGSMFILRKDKRTSEKRGYYLQDVTQGMNPAA